MTLPLFLFFLFLVSLALSWIGAVLTRQLAWSLKAIDQPAGGRKIHRHPTPLLGGIGIGITMIVLIYLGLDQGWFASQQIHPLQLWGFISAIALLLIVGYADDRWDVSVWWRSMAYALACIIIVATGTGIHQVTDWGGGGVIALDRWIWHSSFFGVLLSLSFPGDLLTISWLLAVLYATKFLDGLDGLVSGQTMIGAGLIVFLTLSPMFYQPSVAVLAMIVFGAFAGFLPSNFSPAKQFLGESGSVIAGFSLGFLSIVSGAKVATAFMAIGIPLADALFVVLGRCLRGTSPFQGDDTHLHFKLVRWGMSQRQVVCLYWCLALGAGVLAFGLQTRGKFLLMVALLLGTAVFSWFVGFRINRKKHK